jgi:hypothetical protein
VRRVQLQHIILEIGERFALTEVFVIGSSAILAVLPDPPEGILTATRDVDIIPPNGDERMAGGRIGRAESDTPLTDYFGKLSGRTTELR